MSIWACDGVPRGAGFGIGGIAHPGGGVLGEEHFPHRPRFRGQSPDDVDHRIGALLALGDSAFAGAFGVVGFGAVLIEQEQGEVGGVFEFFGADPDRGTDQINLELLPGGGIDEPGQSVDGFADDLDVFAVDQPVRHGHRGGSQHRRQRRAGHRLPRRQQGSFGQPAISFAAGDPPPHRQHLTPGFGTHLLR